MLLFLILIIRNYNNKNNHFNNNTSSSVCIVFRVDLKDHNILLPSYVKLPEHILQVSIIHVLFQFTL